MMSPYCPALLWLTYIDAFIEAKHTMVTKMNKYS